TMGPLGGIGDALFYLTLLPITASIGASLAIEGNIFGPIIFIVLFNIIHFGSRFGLMKFGYEAGVSAIAKLKEGTKQISRAASIVGLTRSEEHTSELQSRFDLVCRLLLEKKNQ